MNKINKTRLRILCAIPLGIGLLQSLFGFLDAVEFGSLLLSLPVVIIGGTLTGYIAYRWLSVSTGSWDTVVPLGVVSALSIVTMGIVYYVLVPDPIHTVADPQRTFIQVIAFVQFLTAIGLGFTLVPSILKIK